MSEDDWMLKNQHCGDPNCQTEDLIVEGEGVPCYGCKRIFHYGSCSGIAETTQRRKSEKEKKKWKCPVFCRLKTDDQLGSGISDNQDVKELHDKIDKLLKEKEEDKIGKQLKENNDLITQLVKSIADLTAKVSKFEGKINTLNLTVESLDNKVITLEKTVSEQKEIISNFQGRIQLLEKEHVPRERKGSWEKTDEEGSLLQKDIISNLQDRIQFQEQYSRGRNLIINNLPHEKDEDIKDIVSKVIKKSGTNMDVKCINKAHRLPSKNGKIPGIIVQFVIKEDRDTILHKFRGKAKIILKQKDLITAGNEEQVFMNEHMTKYYGELLHMTKEMMKKKGKDCIVWYSDCKVFVRDKDTNKIVHKMKYKSELKKIE